MIGYRRLLVLELVGAWRTRRLPYSVALFLALGIAAAVAGRYLLDLMPVVTDADFRVGLLPGLGVPGVIDVTVAVLVPVAAFVGVVLTAGSVAPERERGITAWILSKPVGRAAFLWAKLLAAVAVLAAGVAIGVLAAWLYTGVLIEPPPPWPWVGLAVAVWLSGVVFAAVGLLGSVVAPTVAGAAAIGLVAYAAMALATNAPLLDPWLPSGLAEVAKSLALQEPSPDLNPPLTAAISGAVIGACFLLAWLGLRRQDV